MENTNAPDQTGEIDRLAAEAELEEERRKQAALAEKAQAKIDELSSTLIWLKGQGVEVKLILNATTDEVYETVEIGKSDWRRTLRIPVGWPMEAKNAYIEDAATGAARAFAAAMRELPEPAPKASKSKDAPANGGA